MEYRTYQEKFKQKYIKYKTKYIHKKHQNMENQMDDTTNADDSPIKQITESYDSSVLDDSTEYTTSTNDSDEFPRNIPIGFAKNIMVILDKDSDYHKDFISVFQKKISKESILSIKTIEEFDEISKRYGKLGNNDDDPDKDFIYLDWIRFFGDYKGLHIDPTLYDDRYTMAIFDGKSYLSWWKNDIDDQLIDSIILYQ